MFIVALAAALLLASGQERTAPSYPTLPTRFMVRGNRHARRRDDKLARIK